MVWCIYLFWICCFGTYRMDFKKRVFRGRCEKKKLHFTNVWGLIHILVIFYQFIVY